ncbi:hypothetical protein JOC54_000184 [Alkalihalobacillus xiaoxiensis]|uniref:Uncharacterized protein n=1 Tax=Shouchella xiaoxiensis TaxID=766895 RepID=A0ABS2SN64_9BACI|nr:hypothetical protein [Shouchella xiaoxiensis]MBM7836953.1 hypothetical protein [Shouchella xiaoxiensis]
MKKYLIALITITLLTATPISFDLSGSDEPSIETRSKTGYV